jgi:hypothetical protein
MNTLQTPIDTQFERFHAANPRVFEVFVQCALEDVADGKAPRANSIFERMRDDLTLSTTGAPFKLPNNLRSRYARLAMVECPELAGAFKIARLKADPDELGSLAEAIAQEASINGACAAEGDAHA